MINRCTILVNSCDAFSDVWELFFKALEIQWSDCHYPIALNTETKKYVNNKGISTINYFSKNGKDCWGKRYKNAVSKIDTKYVMPILDDFVLNEPFSGQNMIDQVMDWMDANPDIGVFYIHKHPNVIQKKTEYKGFGLMPQKCEYKLTTQPAVWRRDFLLKCIKGIENPWEWELYVTRKAWRSNIKMYALLDTEKEVYKFPFGGVIWRGLWHTDAPGLAWRYGVDINFEKRGMMDINNPYRIERMPSLRKDFPKNILKKYFWKEVFRRIHSLWRKIICEI